MPYLYFLGEITNPVLIIWTLTKKYKLPLFDKINPFFTYFFILIRGFVVPIVTYFFIYLLFQEYPVDIYLISFTIVSKILVFGSLYWVKNLYKGYQKYKLKKENMKVKIK